MSGRGQTPCSLERRLLQERRRSAGIDAHGEPVRLGEHDTTGHIVGYIDQDGLGWQSLNELIVAVQGQRLADVLELADSDPRRGQFLEQLLAESPEELIGEIAREAAGRLWLRRGPRSAR
jgi:hypothetical protein